MTLEVDRESAYVESVDQLVEALRGGEKPHSEQRIGAEYERLPFFAESLAPVPYESGVRQVLEGLCRYGWRPATDRPPLLAIFRDGATISVEPGGQFELSGAPKHTLAEISRELNENLDELTSVADPLGVRCTNWGLRPFEHVGEVPHMPRKRYALLKQHFPQTGRGGVAMMYLTATVQANFDFCSEADMVAKMRCAMGVSPVIAAICANSPFEGGIWRGWRSARYALWRDVDPARSGLLPIVFEEGFGYRRYVEWLLDIPVLLLRRAGELVSAAGATFRQLLETDTPFGRPTLTDFENHLGSVFPEVRLKRVIETRCADACPPIVALGMIALWKGLLYDPEARSSAWALVEGLSFAERLAMQLKAAQHGLAARGSGWSMGELARELYRLARAGLERQQPSGADSQYLEGIEEIVMTGTTLADRAIARFGAGPFDESARRQILETAICTRS